MKKIYLSAIALSIGSISIAQNNAANRTEPSAMLEVTATNSAVKHAPINQKAPGDIIWSEDFTGGFPAGWTKGGTTNNGADWVIDNMAHNTTTTTGDGTGFSDIGALASTSGGNFMMYFGEQIAPISDRDAYFQTTAINLTGFPSVTVRFQQQFRLCCANMNLELTVSTDPTFPATAATKTYNVTSGLGLNDSSPNALTTAVNISDLASNYVGDIYLRFHWNLGASHYYWEIDDIEVMESPSNDIAASNGYYGTFNVPYTRIPVAQIQPIDFSAEVINNGGANQTNTIITADINGGGVFTGTSTPVTLNTLTLGGVIADIKDSLMVTTQFTPPATIGVAYTPTITASSDFTDDAPSDNALTFSPFEVSQYIYAQDDYGVNGMGNAGGEDGNAPGSFEYEAGNYYDVYANDNVYGIDVMLGDAASAPANEELDVVLYSIDATTGDFILVDRSQLYLTTGTDAGTLVNFRFDAPIAVTAGTSYFAALHCAGNTDYSYAVSGSSNDNDQAGGTTSLIFYPNMTAPVGNYYTTRTPMVRLSFDPATGVNNVTKKVNFDVYPNPSNGEFNINLTKDMGKTVNLMVKNVVGQVIIDKQIAVTGNQVETISLANYDKGVYFLTINNETVKLIVE